VPSRSSAGRVQFSPSLESARQVRTEAERYHIMKVLSFGSYQTPSLNGAANANRVLFSQIISGRSTGERA